MRVTGDAAFPAQRNWRGEFHPEFGPHAGDVVAIEFWARGGFANTNLDKTLKQRAVE